MPTQAEATDAICQALNDAWQDVTPVEWPNVSRLNDLGQPQPPLHEGNVPWVALHVLHGGGAQESLGPEGGRWFGGFGTLQVSVYVPAGKRGLADADQLSMRAVNAYRGKTVGGVTFHRVGSHTVGLEGNWWRTDVRADFEFDEIA